MKKNNNDHQVYNIEGSSNIAQISYIKSKKELRVLMHNTAEYVYQGVSQDEVTEIVEADSVGSAFNRIIVKNYKGEKQ